MNQPTPRQMRIGATLALLGELLDLEYGVKDEFTGVLTRAINKHVELIEEDE